MGCQRGCTFARTLDRSERVEKVQGTKVIFTARLIDYRNSRAVNRNIFKRSVTHTYAVVFSANLLGFEAEDFYAESVADPDNVDLDKELKRIQIKISKDKKHVGLAVDKQTQDVIHLYKKQRVQMESDNATSFPSWSSLDVNSFPSPSSMMQEEIKNHCHEIFMNEDLITQFLDNCGPKHSAHGDLLAQWPDCGFASDYYSDARIQKLKRNKIWKSKAEARVEEVLNEGRLEMLQLGAYDFMEAFNTQKINNALDSVYASNWSKIGHHEMRVKVFLRLGKPGAISKKWRKQIIDEAKTAFRKFDRTGEEDKILDAETSLRAILVSGDTIVSYNFLKKAMTSSVTKYDSYDLVKAVYDNYDSFTPYQRRWISQQTPVIFKLIKPYTRDTLFDAAIDIVSCDQLKEWKRDYPEDLSFADLPNGCN